VPQESQRKLGRIDIDQQVGDQDDQAAPTQTGRNVTQRASSFGATLRLEGGNPTQEFAPVPA
jgi:hypothetical protein